MKQVHPTVSKSATSKARQKPPKQKHLPKSRGQIDCLTRNCWNAAAYAYSSEDSFEPPNLDFIDLSAFIPWSQFEDCQDVDSLKKLLPNQAARRRGETKDQAENRAQKQLETFHKEWKKGSQRRRDLFDRAEKTGLHELVSQLWSSAVFTSNGGFTLEAQFEAIRLYSAELWAFAQRKTGATIIQPSPVYSDATTREIRDEAIRIFCREIDPPSPQTIPGEEQLKELANASAGRLLNAAAALFTSFTPLMLLFLRAAIMADAKFFEGVSKTIQDLRDGPAKDSFGVLKPKDQHEYRLLCSFLELTQKMGRLPTKLELKQTYEDDMDMSESEFTEQFMSNLRKECGLSGLPKAANGDALPREI